MLPAQVRYMNDSSPDCIFTNGDLACFFPRLPAAVVTNVTVATVVTQAGLVTNVVDLMALSMDTNPANDTASAVIEALPFTVTNTSAVNEEANMSITHLIQIDFSQPVDPASIDIDTFTVRGRQFGIYPGSLLSPSATVLNLCRPVPFLFGEPLQATLSTGIVSVSGIDLTLHTFQFRAEAPGCPIARTWRWGSWTATAISMPSTPTGTRIPIGCG